MTANKVQQTPIPKFDDESEKRIAEIADYYFNDDGMGRYRCIKAMREYHLELAGLREKVEAETIERCAKVCEHEYADPNWNGMYRQAAANCSASIRALSQPLTKK